MRTDQAYRAAVADLAFQSASGQHPGYELENHAARIASHFGVSDSDVRDDASKAQDLLTVHADELAAMRARRAEITAERETLGESDWMRAEGIAAELDSIDARLGELGIALDAVA